MKEGKNSFEIATGAIQRLLYEKPLYSYATDGRLNIIVFGFSELCRRFIDLAFEVSQVDSYSLSITLVTDNENAKEEYLSARPYLNRFFSIDGNEVDDSYGKLLFVTEGEELSRPDIISKHLSGSGEKYSYIFIDCNCDRENIAIANACRASRRLLADSFIINLALDKERKAKEPLNQVIRSNTIAGHRDYPRLKRMALNCHLLWNSSDYMDIRRLQRSFNSNYNFSSSLSNVLSVKYKLNSLGIDFDDADAPEKFRSVTEADGTLLPRLVKAEHDRWNVSMLCNGWSAQLQYKRCVNGIKDKENKLHPCLVHCNAEMGLDSWRADSFEKWDTATNAELEALDRLDNISVKLYRLFKSRASSIKASNSLFDNDIYEIQKSLAKNEKASLAFSKYLSCIKEIVNGSSSQVRQYEFYKDRLFRALGETKKSVESIVRKRVDLIEQALFPVFECEKHTDYKAIDYMLVKNIPFILTYRTNIHIGIPLETNNDNSENRVLFRNTASSLLINPSSVTYFYEYRKEYKGKIAEALKYICRCMDAHNIRATINLCLFSSEAIEEIDAVALKGISDRIKRVDTLECADEDELEKALNSFIKHRRFTAIERNNSKTSGIFYGMRVFRSNPYYTFDSRTSELNCLNGCNELKYIPFKPALKISDLFESKASIDKYSTTDFQQDYMFFWSLYKESSETRSAWKCLCNLLAELSKKENTTYIRLSAVGSNDFSKREYFVESYCIDTMDAILKKMHNPKRKNDFNYKIEFQSMGLYKIIVNGTEDIHKGIKRLLAKPYLLANRFDVEIDNVGETEIITLNSLYVGKLHEVALNKKKTNDLKSPYESVKKILLELSGRNYIISLQERSDNEGRYFSFTYSSHQLKELMTTAGRLFELYVYHKLKNASFVDNIANSVEVERESNPAKNELDIVLTSGLQSVIIECKAQSRLDQQFYYKLDNLNRLFGINSIGVLVADLNEAGEYEENQIQISRGKEFGIATIYESDDIDNIDKAIEKLIKKRR